MHMWISKESSKYQYSYWHLKWPQSYTLAYIWRWKGRKRWNRRCYFSQKFVLRWKVCPKKRMGNKLPSIILNVCYFNTGLRICKWHKFGIKDCYSNLRRHVSYITKYRLLVWIAFYPCYLYLYHVVDVANCFVAYYSYIKFVSFCYLTNRNVCWL